MIEGLDHIQINAPKGHEDEARAFFGELLGLLELKKPESLRSSGGVWFGLPDGRQLHTGVSEPFAPSKKGHVCLRVRNLDIFAEFLEVEGVSLEWDGRADARRVFLFDPWGNRLEIVEGFHPSVPLELEDVKSDL